MTRSEQSAVERRRFLFVLGIGAGLAAMAAALGGEARANSDANSNERKPRYNPNSKDVKTYYRVNRY